MPAPRSTPNDALKPALTLKLPPRRVKEKSARAFTRAMPASTSKFRPPVSEKLPQASIQPSTPDLGQPQEPLDLGRSADAGVADREVRVPGPEAAGQVHVLG